MTHRNHSYLKASIGSSRDADSAGANPETMPVIVETISPVITRPSENFIGNDGNAAATAADINQESVSPTTPPTRQMATASTRNCSRIERRFAPIAFRVPISRVRSFTLTYV